MEITRLMNSFSKRAILIVSGILLLTIIFNIGHLLFLFNIFLISLNLLREYSNIGFLISLFCYIPLILYTNLFLLNLGNKILVQNLEEQDPQSLNKFLIRVKEELIKEEEFVLHNNDRQA